MPILCTVIVRPLIIVLALRQSLRTTPISHKETLMSRRLTIKETASALVGANTSAVKLSAKITIGNALNDRISAMIVPKLPAMVGMIAKSNPAITKAILANAVSAAIMNLAPTNNKALLASDAMINAAMLEFVGSFNIEAMINDALNGLDLSVLGDTDTTFEIE